MSLDMKDPFEVHAYFALLFTCDRCGKDLQPIPKHEMGSDDYCKEFAVTAKARKWFCPPPEPDGSMHVMFCLCPDCVPFKEEELKKTKWKKLS
jgi:hypothetical protein